MSLFSKLVVTGGAGFIGSHFIDLLVENNVADQIIVIDNLSSGSVSNIEHHLTKKQIELIIADLKQYDDSWITKFRDTEAVIHLAANPEVRVSSIEPKIHFDENIVATFNVLEAARKNDVEYHFFASSSTVYGDAKNIPTPETYPYEPISVYGASKAACEILYHSYFSLYGFSVSIARYANIIGPRSSHGVIVDFINKLKRNPIELEILGDGTQRKSYLYVQDTVEASFLLLNLAKNDKGYHVYNVGNEDWVTVKEIADIVVEEMNLRNTKYVFRLITSDGRGWPGDVKLMLLDISKLKSLGWRPKLSSAEAVRRTVRDLLGK
ncbi:MAG: NAD-dependent epimerase/dehydratase family protein [Ignisphaera sp.]|uniref:NAD-dependent epimerase/dehydratase family protein n=1 Tax=Ignisphaera aggregans TaxID=334771 RepID=A0A7C4NPV8_9CREN